MKLADRTTRVKPSPTLAITAKAAELKRQGLAIIGLGAGEPDFDTPAHIKQAGIDAINAGFTKYTPVDGIPELKSAIQAKFKKDNDLSYELDEIIVTVGGKQSCYNLCQALLNPGDEVIIPAPYWVSYPDMVLLAEAEPVIVQTDIEQHFKITPEELEAAITPKTRLMFLNSPSNPTGVAYSRDELQDLAEVLLKYPDIVIATDDMYEHIMWNHTPFNNIVNACPALKDRTLVLNGVSKAYSMTGWRIGYTAGPKDIIKAMKKIQSQSTSNPCSIAQKAAVAALTGDQSCIAEMLGAFKRRHDFLLEGLNELPGVTCMQSDGTFYAFPDVSGAMATHGFENDTDFCAFLLEKAQLAVVPGSAFGAPGCMRLSFATSDANLEEALKRLKAVL